MEAVYRFRASVQGQVDVPQRQPPTAADNSSSDDEL
jgi:hypothetical protein